MKTILWILLVAACLAPFRGFAAIDCDGKNLKVYYANGMMNTPAEALSNLYALRNTLRTHPEYDRIIAPSLSYNQSDSFFEDAMQANSQIHRENTREYFLWNSGLGSMLGDSLRAEFDELFAATLQGLTALEWIVDSDLRHHVASYQLSLNSNRNVLIIAHSQGNLYANAAWDFLRAAGIPNLWNDFGIVSVATPSRRSGDATNNIFMKPPYVTHTADLIIRPLPDAFGANVGEGEELRALQYDLSGHGFQEIYLNRNLSAVYQIEKHISLVARRIGGCGTQLSVGGNSLKQFRVGFNSIDGQDPSICLTPYLSAYQYTCPYPFDLSQSSTDLIVERYRFDFGSTMGANVTLTDGPSFNGTGGAEADSTQFWSGWFYYQNWTTYTLGVNW